MSVIITVPHSCFNHMNKRHLCDFTSKEAVLSLYKNLNLNTIILFGNINRFILDLNRKESRKIRWRLKLSKLMKKASLILDVHSFPKYSLTGEIVFLTLKSEPYTIDLVEFLRKRGIDANMIKGSFKNDIIKEARERGIKYILLEYNESLDSKRVNYISKKISLFIGNILLTKKY